MPCVGFEPTIPASERAKTVHALDRAATVTGLSRQILVIKSRRMRWAGRAVRTGENCVRCFSARQFDGTDYLEDLGTDERELLILILSI
jgi:hypothetical protein